MTFTPTITTSDELAKACAEDGEFMLAARFWEGGVKLAIGDLDLTIKVCDGKVSGENPDGLPDVLSYSGPPEIWAQFLAATPPPMLTDSAALTAAGLLNIEADPVAAAQYYPAAARLFELMRPAGRRPAMQNEARAAGTHDAPVGRYVHLTIDHQDYRIYYEEAGRGIPLILQHTAGAHGTQYRHLFENKAITDHFRLLAYDLPFHGKSIPPVGQEWWRQPYRLTGDFLRQVPLSFSKALELQDPVFMGCSVGGLLALDLALHHPDLFRAVISVEGALKIQDGAYESFFRVYHPQISNEFKARLMNSAISPTAPEGYAKETMQVYAAGWPPAFHGDLYYYLVDYDLTETAASIDTSQVAVHILSGEYDISGRADLGEAAHKAIAGSTWTLMKGIGHFAMQEHPVAFTKHLQPILDNIRESS